MVTRLHVWWTIAKSSLWFVPTVMTLAAVALFAVTIYLDTTVLAERRPEVQWIFGGSVEGARGVLSAIAGGIITVTGVVFSVTIVALQLASTQFTPRVLRNFMRDRANQIVLGVFIATFVYSVLVLRTVRTGIDGGTREAFVPSLSVTVAVVLTLVSIGFLIFFIDHTARSIQASTVIARALRDAIGRLDHLFPGDVGEPAVGAEPPGAPTTAEPARLAARQGGFFQHLDGGALFRAADGVTLTIRMEKQIGEYVLPGSTLASVWPAAELNDDLSERLRQAFVLGQERSLVQDVEFGIRQLVDIAAKALSPGINDPTTARICIDHLAHVIVELAQRETPPTRRVGADGRVLLIARTVTYEQRVKNAFSEIRHFGVSLPHVAAHTLDILGEAAAIVPLSRRPPLVEQARFMRDAALRAIRDPAHRAEVVAAAAWITSDDAPARQSAA